MTEGKITRIVGGLNSIKCESWTVYTNKFTAYAGEGSYFTADKGTNIGEPKELPKAENDSNVFYETDGHYSTVYLVCLMLGMNEYDAEELAIATEAPDTTIHSETDFELNDTWFDSHPQEDIHSLTGGFHGVEEFVTALKFLWLKAVKNEGDSVEEIKKNTVKRLGELLHRFGDSYAHTKFDNIKPEDIRSYNLKNNPQNEFFAIKSWKGQGAKQLSDDVKPWINFINYYTEKYGYSFLTDQVVQKKVFKENKTLEEMLKDVYLLKPTDKFIMYGEKKDISGRTHDHFETDKGYPDLIYMRPEWYLNYVKNLAWLLSIRYNMNEKKLDISVFERMTQFASHNKCSMKGIIDFEIAKIRNKKIFYVPVFYSSPERAMASVDAVFNTDYMSNAEDAKNFTVKYIKEQGLNPSVQEIEGNIKVSFVTDDFFYSTEAFKITY